MSSRVAGRSCSSSRCSACAGATTTSASATATPLPERGRPSRADSSPRISPGPRSPSTTSLPSAAAERDQHPAALEQEHALADVAFGEQGGAARIAAQHAVRSERGAKRAGIGIHGVCSLPCEGSVRVGRTTHRRCAAVRGEAAGRDVRCGHENPPQRQKGREGHPLRRPPAVGDDEGGARPSGAAARASSPPSSRACGTG